MERQLVEIEERSGNPELWQDAAAAAKLQQERTRLERTAQQFRHLAKLIGDAEGLMELIEDAEIAAEVDNNLATAKSVVEKFELQRMLGGEYDGNNALVQVNAGAGGTESQDWAQMLMRMISRWAEQHDFKIEILDTQFGEEAGIKSCALEITGQYAYGYLKAEQGVHRLVRISPYDSAKRRHTSFASVGVVPEIDDDVKVEIRDEDLRVDTYRASGAGGQHVNKTESAIRLTHIPTGVVVACQAERSQHKNRDKAMKMLRAKLFELELRKREEERERLAGDRKKIEWGSQIRSYVLQPYRMVKDHRTGHESGNTEAVLNGDIDGFIEAYLLGKTASGDEKDLE